jgi:cell pole-organizing protein PopZ
MSSAGIAMANANQAQEPSMEEILASIRRIISDEEPAATAADAGEAATSAEEELVAGEAMSQDDLDKLFDSDGDMDVDPVVDEPVVEEPAEEEEPETVAAEVDDVFELTEDLEVEEDASDAEMAFSGKPDVDEADDDLAFVEPDDEPSPAPSFQSAGKGKAAPSIEDSLLSADANQAVHSAFSNLAGTILSNNARTLEDLVKELLRPMLKTWLDENLPPMVERMVRQEIERISRGR